MAGAGARVLFVVASLLGCGAAAAAEQPSAAQMMDDLMYGRGSVGGPFTLTDQTGRQRSDAEFRGKLMIVYFGYAFCPDVCPADLMAITQALDALGPAAEGVQPIFITIDPERDTKGWRTTSLLSIAALWALQARPRRSARSLIPTRPFT